VFRLDWRKTTPPEVSGGVDHRVASMIYGAAGGASPDFSVVLVSVVVVVPLGVETFFSSLTSVFSPLQPTMPNATAPIIIRANVAFI
jgi:hypothetical protein